MELRAKGDAEKVSPEQWFEQFRAMVIPTVPAETELQTMSTIHVTRLLIPGMRRKKWGRILTSASSGVVAPIPNLGIPNTLRSALVGCSKTLAGEVAADGNDDAR